MAPELFSIRCPTCQRGLRVRSVEAIGQILACPKCGSMVHIVPPSGWSETQGEPAEADVSEVVTGLTSEEPVAASASEILPSPAQEPSTLADEQPPVLPPWLSLTEAALRKWTLYVGLPIACAVVTWAIASVLLAPDSTQPVAAEDQLQVAPRPDGEQPVRSENVVASPAPVSPPENESDEIIDPVRLAAAEAQAVGDAQEPSSTTSPSKTLDDTQDNDSPRLPPALTDRDPDTSDTAAAAAGSAPDEAPSAPERTPLSSAINIQARLSDKVLAIDQPNISLTELIDLLSALSTIPITFDLDEMTAVGVHPDDEISVKMTDASIRDVLQSALEPLGLEFAIENNQLRITSPRPLDRIAR